MEQDPITGRIGIFFILIGALLIGLFVMSDLAGKAEVDYLLYGAGGVLLGLILRWISPRPEKPPPERFRLLRARREKRPRRGLFNKRSAEQENTIRQNKNG